MNMRHNHDQTSNRLKGRTFMRRNSRTASSCHPYPITNSRNGQKCNRREGFSLKLAVLSV